MNKRQKKPKRSQMLAGTSKQSSQDNFDCIPMSRQLKTKKQARGRIKRTPVKRTMNRKMLHTQNQPLPTFKDLEKMFEDPAVLHTAPNITSNSINPSLSTTEVNKELEQNITDIINDRNNGSNTDNLHLSDENIVEIPNKINCDNFIQTISLIGTMMPKVIDCNEIITIDDDEPEHNEQDRKRKLVSPENNRILKIEYLDGEKPQKLRKLQNLDLPKDDSGSDSDVTVVYDLEAPPIVSPVNSSSPPIVSPINSSSPFKRFSPLPSTSTDSATILKNDKIFLECLSANRSSIETEELDTTNKQELPIVIDDDYDELPSVSTKNTTRIEISQPVSIDIDEVVVTTSNIDDDIDIDEIIACNRTLLTKYKTVENLPEVIEVAPVESITTSNITHNVSDHIEIGETPFAERQKTNQIIPSTATDSFSTSSTNATTSNTIMNATIDYILSRNTTRSTSNNLTNATHSHTSSINNVHSTNNNLINAASSNVLHHISTPRVNNLHTSSMANSSQSPEVSAGLNCPICLDNLRSTECASTLCGHIFCMACIKRALRSSRRCPTCRKTIKGNNGYHRLFL